MNETIDREEGILLLRLILGGKEATRQSGLGAEWPKDNERGLL